MRRPKLRDGDVIPVAEVQTPPDIGSLLDATNTALQAIPQDNLRTVVDEAAKAVGGLGPELSRHRRRVDGAGDRGRQDLGPLTQLIDQSPPVLDSQVRTSDSIAAWAAHMASITGQFKAQDAAFADLLRVGGPGLDEGKALFDRIAPTLPVLLANLVSLGDIAVTYRSDLEQLLVLFPQGTAVMQAIAVADPESNSPTGASIWTSTSTSTCRRHATPDSCRCSSSAPRPTWTIPNVPPATCTAGSRRTPT